MNFNNLFIILTFVFLAGCSGAAKQQSMSVVTPSAVVGDLQSKPPVDIWKVRALAHPSKPYYILFSAKGWPLQGGEVSKVLPGWKEIPREVADDTVFEKQPLGAKECAVTPMLYVSGEAFGFSFDCWAVMSDGGVSGKATKIVEYRFKDAPLEDLNKMAGAMNYDITIKQPE